MTPRDICARNVRQYRQRLLEYLTRNIAAGIESGDFVPAPVQETAVLILSLINGIVRYSGSNIDLDPGANLRQAAVDFCRRSLMQERVG